MKITQLICMLSIIFTIVGTLNKNEKAIPSFRCPNGKRFALFVAFVRTMTFDVSETKGEPELVAAITFRKDQ